jgi:hypothetical protein
MFRPVVIVLSAGLIASCAYYPPPPAPVYTYVPCPTAAVPPPPDAVAPAPVPPGGANGSQCLAATVPYPPYQYYVAPGYYPSGAPYYPGAGVSFGFGGVIR